ncbi:MULTISPECIES: hypothetical protein [unclassified Sphingomonas]|jgi:ABC-2 type transport system permease protein|uniref:hypothetical protein n=1 Tax=unclassified Sphingomonas TaxID=196159 RepID=UPI000E10CCB3|nr:MULTISPECIES: hypothetical protein [unclassified Sphingomonas]AXJ94871.1 hypothetical protein DM480_04490 [Sphingomonas sp. FARSPH]
MTRPGSLPWLVAHEMRLAWRGRPRGWGSLIVVGVLLGAYLLGGIAVAVALAGTPLHPVPALGPGIFGATVLLVSLMTTQAMLASQQTLYGTRDLDLMLTAPLPPRRAILAKLLGIAASVVVTAALLLLPALLPIALIGHPRLLGAVALLAILAAAAAAIGLALTLAIARLAGPRAARTAGQIAAAVMGGAFFLTTQIVGHQKDGAARGLFGWFEAHRIGADGWSALPFRAAFGDGTALSLMSLVSIALFVAVGVVLERQFLSTYADGGMHLSRRRRPARGLAGLFHASLGRTIFAKEWRLLARDPALIAQILMRLIYMLPIVFVGLRHGGGGSLAPMLAFAAVLIASQLAGSLAWLALSAEDAPELLAVAPIDIRLVRRAKLTAALAIAAPFAILPALAIASMTVAGALVTLVMAALASIATGAIELAMGKPASRTSFARRQKGSLAASLLTLLVAIVCGGGTAAAVFFLVR